MFEETGKTVEDLPPDPIQIKMSLGQDGVVLGAVDGGGEFEPGYFPSQLQAAL